MLGLTVELGVGNHDCRLGSKDLRQFYLGREYDPAAGLRFDAWVVGGDKK